MAVKGEHEMQDDPVYQRSDGLWDWRLKAKNGEIIATSGGQGFTEKNDAQEGYDRVKAALQEGKTE